MRMTALTLCLSFSFCACATEASVASSDDAFDRSDRTGPPAAGSRPPEPPPAAASKPKYLTLDDLPECDAQEPDLACIKKLFLPLRSTTFPFDAGRVDKAFAENAFAVAPGWNLTAHHVLEQNLAVGVYGCFFPSFRYAEDLVPINGPGCGEMLVAGGHPHASECQTEGTPISHCVDEVPFGESFDLVLAKAETRAALLDIAQSPSVGDEVFAVGYPLFYWLSAAERAELAPLYPLVSYGHVRAIEGRGIVVDAAVYGGNSGGPLLNAKGEALGVLSSLVGHQRARGTSVPAARADRFGVVAAIDDATRTIIDHARQTP